MSWARGGRAAVALALALGLAACQVRPLYSTGPSGVAPQAALPAIDIEAPDDRPEQVFRNELAFTTGAGGAPPAYQLVYTLAIAERGAGIQAETGVPTLYQVGGNLTYELRSADGALLLKDRATVVTSFDRSSQNFANIRALRDAEDRIAIEAARQVQTRLATWFAARR